MDIERAKEIMSSPGKINVLYNGSPVWLENINENNTVHVTLIDSHSCAEVPVYKLVESYQE